MIEEKQMIHEAKTGKMEAIVWLWEQYRPLWRRWARTTYLEGYGVEDLEQQSYLILLETLEKYREMDGMPFGGYYKMRLAIWRSRKLRKKRELSSNVEHVEREMMGHQDEAELIAEQVERKVLAQWAVKEIEKLDEGEKKVLIGYLIEAKSLEQMGKEMGLSLSGVKSKKRRSLMKLRKRIPSLK